MFAKINKNIKKYATKISPHSGHTRGGGEEAKMESGHTFLRFFGTLPQQCLSIQKISEQKKLCFFFTEGEILSNEKFELGKVRRRQCLEKKKKSVAL